MTKGQIIHQLSASLFRLSEGDLTRVQKFVDALVTQKEGKHETRQSKIRKWNVSRTEGLGDN